LHHHGQQHLHLHLGKQHLELGKLQLRHVKLQHHQPGSSNLSVEEDNGSITPTAGFMVTSQLVMGKDINRRKTIKPLSVYVCKTLDVKLFAKTSVIHLMRQTNILYVL
jgi:hypothetical protein